MVYGFAPVKFRECNADAGELCWEFRGIPHRMKTC
jgi:hypothetical protein